MLSVELDFGEAVRGSRPQCALDVLIYHLLPVRL